MHNPVEEALTEASRPASIRQCTVLTGESPVPDPDYPVGAVEIETEEGILTVAVIAIIEVEGKVVVAVPTTAWHRKAKQRLLPPGSLEKAVAVQVEFINREGDEPFTSLGPKKIWLGYLSKRAEELVVFEPAAEVEEASVDTPFASESVWHLPEASALVAVADQHFAFVSAVSEGATGGASFDHRLSALEQSVQTIAASVAKLVDTPIPIGCSNSKTSIQTVRFEDTMPDPETSRIRRCRTYLDRPELDQEVMRSARQAGIPEEQIAEMARLASRGRPKMADLPASSSKPHIRFVDPLEESEEDLADVEETNLLSGDPMQDAVTKLTQIAAQLTKQKTPSRSLESLLDGSGSAHSSEGLFNIQSEVCSGTEGSSESTSPATPLHLQHDRAEHERRLPGADSTSRDSTSGLLSPSMVGTTISSSTFPDSCTPPLGALQACWTVYAAMPQRRHELDVHSSWLAATSCR